MFASTYMGTAQMEWGIWQRSMITNSWVLMSQGSTCIEDETRQHKPSLGWDFCSESYGALVTWWPSIQVTWALSGEHERRLGDTVVLLLCHNHIWMLDVSLLQWWGKCVWRQQEDPDQRWLNLIIQASLEERWKHPSPWRNTENRLPQLNPRGRTRMWAKVGSCHSTVVIFSCCHLSWWWNDHCCL